VDPVPDDLQAPTVNLAARIESAPDPSPEETAVLELRPTVDLASRLDPAPEDSRPRS
jgi:hypothetical protein